MTIILLTFVFNYSMVLGCTCHFSSNALIKWFLFTADNDAGDLQNEAIICPGESKRSR